MASSAMIMEAPGSFSDVLMIMVLPQARDRGNIHSGIMAGKLKLHFESEPEGKGEGRSIGL